MMLRDRSPFADDHDTLRVVVLRRHGLLGDHAATVRVSWPRRIITVTWDPETRLITLRPWHIGPLPRDDDELNTVTVRVVRTAGARGRLYFLCPHLGQPCDALFHAEGGGWASREAQKLEYLSSKEGPLERRSRQAKGEERPPYKPRDPQILDGPPKPRVETPAKPMGTQGALNAIANWSTEKLELVDLARSFVSSEEIKQRESLPPPLPHSTLLKATLEVRPRLEIDELKRRGFVVEGARHTFAADWKNAREGLTIVIGHVDIADPLSACIFLSSEFSSTHIWRSITHQLIRLTPPDNSRRRQRSFICPCTGKPARILAFREGRWASPVAQNLTHQSQRSARFGRHDKLGFRDFEQKASPPIENDD